MRCACRVKRDSIIPSCQGIWRLLELWAYEYFPKLGPQRPQAQAYLALLSWVGPDVAKVEFRPWAGIAIPQQVEYAMTLSLTRRVFWSVTDPMWYLGERVARQHSTDVFFVPMDPPHNMMNADLKSEWEGPRRSVGVEIDWRDLALHGGSYTEFRIRLAPSIEYRPAERNFAGGDVPFAETSLEYATPSGTVREPLAEPPEVAFLSTRSFPLDFERFTREGSERVLRVLDGYRWHSQALNAERAWMS